MYRYRHRSPWLAALRWNSAGARGAAHPRRSAGLSAGLLLLMWAPAGSGQQHEVVSSRIEVSGDAASLRLGFANGETLAIEFADGVARLNGDEIGPYMPGGASDRAWRGLLESVESLSGALLAQRLDRWTPDAELPETDLLLLRGIEEALDAAFATAGQPPPQDVAAPVGNQTGDIGRAAAILGRGADFLQAWAIAVEDMSVGEAEVRIGEDYTIPEGATVDGSVMHVDGLLEVRGNVRGHVVVLDGTLAVAAGSRIDGDIRTLDSEVADGGAILGGERVDLRRQLEEQEERLRNRIRADAVSRVQPPRAPRTRVPAYFQRVEDAAAGVLGTCVAFVVLGALTLLLSVLGGHRVRSVVGELSSNPMGSTLVGFAGGYAVLPIFLLGVAALTVTVIGIPALLIWVPFFPVVVCLAMFAGFVGAAENIGRWVLGLDFRWLDRFDADRPFTARLAGLVTLLLPFAAGSIFIALPLIDWVAGILFVAGTLACVVAVVAGFGAVLITRGGTVGTRWSGRFKDEDDRDAEDWPAGEKVP